jgi:hypothetical protein
MGFQIKFDYAAKLAEKLAPRHLVNLTFRPPIKKGPICLGPML